MTYSIAYWILMLLLLVFGFWSSWPNYKASGVNLIIFILLVLIGLELFGKPIHH